MTFLKRLKSNFQELRAFAPAVLIFMILVAGLVLIYSRSQSFGIPEQIEIAKDLRKLEFLDAEWVKDVISTKSGQSLLNTQSHPDEELIDLKAEMRGDLMPLKSVELHEVSADLDALLLRKVGLVKTYLAGNAALFDLLHTIEMDTDTISLSIGQAIKVNPKEAISLSDLRVAVQGLLSATLKFHILGNEANKTKVADEINQLESIKLVSHGDFALPVTELIYQAKKIVEAEEQAASLLPVISNLSVRGHTEKIDQILSDEYHGEIEQQAIYRNYLFWYAAALVLLITQTVVRILKSMGVLKNMNKFLDAAVEDRTAEYKQAMLNLKESQANLVQSEKMAMLGTMVAGVTHEINTPLGYVKNGIFVTKKRLGLLDDLVTEITWLKTMMRNPATADDALGIQVQKVVTMGENIEQSQITNELIGLANDGLFGVETISKIVSSLKNFSRVDRERLDGVSINTCLDDTLRIATNLIKTKKIVKAFDSSATISCSPASINQVLLNIISNAAQATGDDGSIEIRSYDEAGFVRVSIIDNGSGIPADTIAKIFDPFFTTKKMGEGTGLGLYISHGIIEDHDGSIEVKSTVGVGTCFIVSLPISATK